MDQIAIGTDGKLYADVWMYNDVLDDGSSHYSMFVWDASALIQAALYSRNQKTSTPIDRISTQSGAAGQRPEAVPQRYDSFGNGQKFFWSYGVGAYSVPGRFAVLKETTLNTPAIVASGGESNVYKDMLGISDKQVAQAKEDGTYSAFESLAKSVFYNGWNFFTLGYLERQAERYNQYSGGNISGTSYLTSFLVDGVTTVASIVVGGRIAGGLSTRLGTGTWGAVAGSAADAGLVTIIQKEGEIISYEISDPGKLDGTYARKALTELTIATALGAGFPLLGAVMSGGARNNYKVMWNSPNELNPTRYKIVQPTVSNKNLALVGSVADSTGGSILSHVGGTLEVAGGKLIQLPKLGSLTIDEALAMQRTLANDLPTMVNKNASLYEQAFQAVQIKNDLIISVRTAMDDANAAAQLSMISPVRSFDEMVRARSKEYAGDALYRQVIADAQAEMRQAGKAPAPYGLCFAAGTLIHTEEGLKPIEQIQVGDWVLTQPEETGERTYKRVTRTTQFEDAPVWSVTYFRGSELDRAQAENRMMPIGVERRLVVTPNHPLWVRGKGWVQVKNLDFDSDELLLSDGDYARIEEVSPLYRTANLGVAWQASTVFTEWDGQLFDLRNGVSGEFEEYRDDPAPQSFSYWDENCYARRIKLGDGSYIYGRGAYQPKSVETWNESCYYRCSVYNFEVEDCHTYYVGTEGVWAHNTNCGETVSDLLVAQRNNLVPSNRIGLVFSKDEAYKLPPPYEGVILVRQPKGSVGTGADFQATAEGVQRIGDDFAEFGYLYPALSGKNLVLAGDARALMPNGNWSKTEVPYVFRLPAGRPYAAISC